MTTTTYLNLGQVTPSATTLTTLYTVPAATASVCSTLSVCNTDTAAATYRVAVRVAGAAINIKQYLVYDATINGNDSIFLTLGVTVTATDVISVYSSTATLTFNLSGSQIA